MVLIKYFPVYVTVVDEQNYLLTLEIRLVVYTCTLCLAAEGIVFWTEEKHAYDTMWLSETTTNFHIFHVRAHSNARLALTPGLEDTQSGYEVVIGGDNDTLTYIKYINEEERQASAETQGILISSALSTFWIRFDNGVIEVGTGDDVGAYTVLSWTDTRTPTTVKAIAYSTDASTRGHWSVDEFRGTYI